MSVSVWIDTVNITELASLYHRAPRVMDAEIRKLNDDIARIIITALKAYPHRPNSRYQRTYRLRRGWHDAERITMSDWTLTFSNPVPYVKWVQGEQQAWMHKPYWRTVRQILDAFRDDIARMTERALDRVVDSVER